MQPLLQVRVRFYAELNDFLPPAARQREFGRALLLPAAVKDLVESLGAPHTEIDLILANGHPVDFSYLVQDGDRIGVYPPFCSLDLSPLPALRPPLPRPVRFVVDTHLGRLAAYLRLLGFDTLYQNDSPDEELAAASSREQRVLLTRDLGLLKRGEVTYGYWVRSKEPERQLDEVVLRFTLAGSLMPFGRCLRCNGVLEVVAAADVAGELPPGVSERYRDFRRCPTCGGVYWQGSHYTRLDRLVARVRSLAAGS